MGLMDGIWKDGLKIYEECLFRLIAKENCKKVLDLGCGDGKFTIKVAKKLGISEIIGVDNDLQKSQAAEALGLKVVISDLNHKLPLDDSSFDLVFSNFVIEHLLNVDNFVMEIKRVLKICGCAVIGTENLASTHNFLALILGMQPFPMSISVSSKYRLGNRFQTKNLLPLGNDESPHIRVFAYQGLYDLFKVYSFKVEKIVGAGYPPFLGRMSSFFSGLDPRHSAFNLIKVRKV